MKVNLVMPMAGAGSRFFKRGFTTPKPLIDLCGSLFFERSIKSIIDHVEIDKLIFVVLKEHIVNFKIDQVILERYPNAKIIALDEVTDGAVITCLAAVPEIQNDSPIIFNDCDHAFESSELYQYCKQSRPDLSGALITFASNSPKYSYVRFHKDGEVAGTVEKEVVSDQAICGAYYFKNAKVFKKYAKRYLKSCQYKEFFMSGVYNEMIGDGQKIGVFSTDHHLSFGTVEEYELAVEKVKSGKCKWSK